MPPTKIEKDSDGRDFKYCEKCQKPIFDNTGLNMRVGVALGIKEITMDWCKCEVDKWN